MAVVGERGQDSGLGFRGGMTLPATVPPSTGNTVPVTYRDRSVAK
jgi:hypothetical protein